MPAVPRGPYKNGIKRRREILESAARVFALHGYAGGSLREIANEVGVTPAALIRHFESKESLLVAVLEYWAKEGDTEVPMGDDGLGYFTRFPHLMEYHTKNRGLIALFLMLAAEATNPSHPARQFMTRRYEVLVKETVEQLQAARASGEVRAFSDVELEYEVRGLYAMMDGIELQWLLDPTMDLVATFNYHFSAILQRWTGHPVALD
jgi:AcrR family transcriptional regulator